MSPIDRYAFDVTKKIVVAKMENSTVRSDKDGGKAVADFFEEIYLRVSSLIKSEN